jgi:hypothetical protein
MVELKELWDRYGKESIIGSNRAIDNFRLGKRAGDASDLDSAILFFTRAIERKLDYQEAYLYRGVAKVKKGDATGVVADATEALKLNAQARVTLAQQKTTRHKRDLIGQARDTGTEHYLDTWQALALQIREKAISICIR